MFVISFTVISEYKGCLRIWRGRQNFFNSRKPFISYVNLSLRMVFIDLNMFSYIFLVVTSYDEKQFIGQINPGKLISN